MVSIGNVHAELDQVLVDLVELGAHLHRATQWWEEAAELLRHALDGSVDPEATALLEGLHPALEEAFAATLANCGALSAALAAIIERERTPIGTGPTTPGAPAAAPAPPHPTTLPADLMARGRDPRWAARQQALLADRPGGAGATTGLLHTTGGDGLYLTSGGFRLPAPTPRQRAARRAAETAEERAERDRMERADLVLRTTGHYPWPPQTATRTRVVDHVEVKAATLMAETGLTYGVLLINNELCDGPDGCWRAVRALLPLGSTLVVWERGNTTPVVIDGAATP
ncbi:MULTISPECIES: DddA-like double-stranded DNA deaminase toxin [Actinosynnema]|uniref:DddA-like double-stranded DNA deaminase toxin n=1 Tax=Actinosynnema TaxID=40566 RepID=UPI0020A54AFB|nr:DddA-like double-stranded DNA deaminase toxin [Actinosynnema pretiosum]MCP2097372.1 SCP1.201-like deaminase [Actinosynnema pretiosum]